MPGTPMVLTSITITVNEKDKKQAQRIAKQLGFTLSGVMRALLKDFVHGRGLKAATKKYYSLE